MTLTLDLETSFKVTAHPLTKATLLGKYELHWTYKREYMIWTRIFIRNYAFT